MFLLMQFKFQPVTKYVRLYGTALYCLFNLTGSFTLRAKCTPRYTCLEYMIRNECCYSPRTVYTSLDDIKNFQFKKGQ